MADIGNEIDAIRAAKIGEQVREDIANALEKMNEQAAAAQEWATGQDDPTDEPGETNNAAYYAAQAAARLADVEEAISEIPSDYTELSNRVGIISEPTRNLWRNEKDQEITAASGIKLIEMKNPLPAGTYTVSAVVTSNAAGTGSLVGFYKGAPATEENKLVINAIGRTTRSAATMTISETATHLLIEAGGNASASSGKTATYSNIQIETGAAATDYIAPYTAIDLYTGLKIECVAPVESAFTATRNYVIDDLFYVGNTLYKASGAITSGDTITPGTNCELATISDELKGKAESSEITDVATVVTAISEETRNLWKNTQTIEFSDNGYAHRLLTNPLPAGTYTVSITISRDPVSTTGSAAFVLSRSKTTQITSSTIIETVLLNPASNGSRVSATFTISETAYSVRLTSKDTVAHSSGIAAVFANIQVESGENATAYVPPMTAVDAEARNLYYSIEGGLVPTGDQTDRSEAIENVLMDAGRVVLPSGDFYVSGITMPADTMITGSGKSTRIILLGSVDSGAAITMATNCTIKDCLIEGNIDGITLSQTIGTRNGILWSGQDPTRYRGSIDNVTIHGFTGGGIKLSSTGTPTTSCLEITNVYCHNCNVGVYIPVSSEYHSITNVHCNQCYYGMINNGGNNKISCCGFDSNVVALKMGEDGEDFTNNSHGTYSNCTFNHNDGNTGKALDIIGMNSEIFTGCQFFYGTLNFKNSNIVLNACNFGSQSAVNVTNGDTILLSSCLFRTKADSPITQVSSPDIHLIGCYTRSGAAYTDADIQTGSAASE